MARSDPHSFADDTQARTRSFDLAARLDFETRTITAEVTLSFHEPAEGCLDLDTRDLAIDAVHDASGNALEFTLHEPVPHLGSRLSIRFERATPRLTIRYRTSPGASAAQWLSPAQTKGGVHPFVFTQCQAIHARSLVPLQDTPGLRLTYTAELIVPSELQVVMAAADRGRTENGATAVHRWEMPQPIPPYLFAFAVGDLTSRDLSPRSRVWAEPAVVDAAAREFATWTGNLVTNANAEHFWLNEGFTVYAERRITEATEGVDAAALSAALGRRELDESLKRFADSPGMTRLRTHLDGVDPDDCYSNVPYEKGYAFLVAIEAVVGRTAFEHWLKSYLRDFRFGAITTEQFERHVETALPGVLARADARTWIDGEGMPATASRFASSRLAAIEGLRGQMPAAEAAASWSATEWIWFSRACRGPRRRSCCETWTLASLSPRRATTTS